MNAMRISIDNTILSFDDELSFDVFIKNMEDWDCTSCKSVFDNIYVFYNDAYGYGLSANKIKEKYNEVASIIAGSAIYTTAIVFKSYEPNTPYYETDYGLVPLSEEDIAKIKLLISSKINNIDWSKIEDNENKKSQ